jgi:NAD-dependent dihydropyrimidine dehydrogenase PreA subunit
VKRRQVSASICRHHQPQGQHKFRWHKQPVVVYHWDCCMLHVSQCIAPCPICPDDLSQLMLAQQAAYTPVIIHHLGQSHQAISTAGHRQQLSSDILHTPV